MNDVDVQKPNHVNVHLDENQQDKDLPMPSNDLFQKSQCSSFLDKHRLIEIFRALGIGNVVAGIRNDDIFEIVRSVFLKLAVEPRYELKVLETFRNSSLVKASYR